jgi:hypothetical protein
VCAFDYKFSIDSGLGGGNNRIIIVWGEQKFAKRFSSSFVRIKTSATFSFFNGRASILFFPFFLDFIFFFVVGSSSRLVEGREIVECQLLLSFLGCD